MNRIEDKCL